MTKRARALQHALHLNMCRIDFERIRTEEDGINLYRAYVHGSMIEASHPDQLRDRIRKIVGSLSKHRSE